VLRRPLRSADHAAVWAKRRNCVSHLTAPMSTTIMMPQLRSNVKRRGMGMLDADRPSQVSGFQAAEKESLSGELVLFDPVTQKILYSNQTGALIWGLCDGQRTIADIIQLLNEAYPDSIPEIDAEVRETLSVLVEHGAIEWA
jgi:hypothetical protein